MTDVTYHFIGNHYWETKKIEVPEGEAVDCMISCAWSHGRGLSISIGIEGWMETDERNRALDDTQIEFSLIDALEAFVKNIANGESGCDTDEHDMKATAYDAMISQLEYLKNVMIEKKAFYLTRRTAWEKSKAKKTTEQKVDK